MRAVTPPFVVCERRNCSKSRPSIGRRGPSTIAGRKAIPTRRIEHYWLCDACSPSVTLTFDQGRGVITVPLPDGLGKKTVKMLSWDPVELQGAEDARKTLIEVMK